MGKCKKCGRKGLFFKVNSDGICRDCVALLNIQVEKTELEKQKESLKVQLDDLSSDISFAKQQLTELDAKLDNSNATFEAIKSQAEAAAIASIENKLNALQAECDERSVALKKISTDCDTQQVKCQAAKTKYESYKYAFIRFKETNENDLPQVTSEALSPTIEIDLQNSNVRQLRKLFNENKRSIHECLTRYSDRYTTKANIAIYKLMTIALSAELQNILSSLKYGKCEEAIEAVKSMCLKYLAIATEGNQSIAPTVKKFIGEIEYLFIEAVKIEYEYYVQKERIKEEQRAIREQMRQEAEERKELEKQRKRIEKEEQKFQNEIENVKVQLENSTDEQQQILLARIRELEEQINGIAKQKEQIASLENGKAGHVYIISNIGSFGDDVYKIGMTRRIDPMDRVKELGDASVPFPFDVHGMIFSDDAVGLENHLHKLFNNCRVNKINLRKEFFRVSLDEIEKIVAEKFPSAEFKKTALAEQYRQSLEMESVADELSDEDINSTVE